MTLPKPMALGIQEILALLIVLAVVVFAVYRRWRRRGAGAGDCAGCAEKTGSAASEKPLRFFRRQK